MRDMKRSEISNIDELKRAFKQIKDEEFRDVPGEDELPFEISDSFRDKVMTGSTKRMSAWGRVINSTAKKAAVIAAICTISLGALMSVKAIREPVVEFFRATYEKTATLFRADEETTADAPDDTSEVGAVGGDTEYVTEYSSLSETEEAKTDGDKKPEEKDGRKADGKTDESGVSAENNMEEEPAETQEPSSDDEVMETVAATCEEDGYTLMRKAGSDETYRTDIVPAFGHDYAITNMINSTCTVQGHAYYKCSRCGVTYDEELPLGAHKLVYTNTVKKCGQPKELHYICNVCKQTLTVYKETVWHVFDIVKSVNPTVQMMDIENTNAYTAQK